MFNPGDAERRDESPSKFRFYPFSTDKIAIFESGRMPFINSLVLA
jgi:hypothetical protein